jgi:hypothetical protein
MQVGNAGWFSAIHLNADAFVEFDVAFVVDPDHMDRDFEHTEPLQRRNDRDEFVADNLAVGVDGHADLRARIEESLIKCVQLISGQKGIRPLRIAKREWRNGAEVGIILGHVNAS